MAKKRYTDKHALQEKAEKEKNLNIQFDKVCKLFLSGYKDVFDQLVYLMMVLNDIEQKKWLESVMEIDKRVQMDHDRLSKKTQSTE